MANSTLVSMKKWKSLVGARVEIPVHYDMWMRGARFGRIVGWRNAKPGMSACVLVQLDNRAKRLKVWALDVDYMKVLP